MERYHQAIAQLAMFRQEALESTRTDLGELAVQIAKEVLLSQPEKCREFTDRMVDEALKSLSDAESITLRLSPTDVAAIHEKHLNLLKSGRIKIIEDQALHLGGVIAHCELGKFDASIESRLREVAKRFASLGSLDSSNDDVPANDASKKAG